MSRRGSGEDIGFGSDSFLDVVANLVGILIILIVIAGVRMSQAPVRLGVGDAEIPPSPSDAVEPDAMPLDVGIAASEPPAAVSLKPAEPPPELVQRTAELEAELNVLDSEAKHATATVAGFGRRMAELQSLRGSKQQQLAALSDAARSANGQLAQTQLEIAQLQSALRALQAKVREVESAGPNVEKLQHEVTPISRVVHGREQHFRLSENRVAEIPLTELISRLKEQLERKKDWVAKFPRHEGVAGPVRGFTLHYLVEREPLSVLDEVRLGTGGYRIAVAQWLVEPEPDLDSETAEQALRPGSRFYQSLLVAEPDTTLTFWVYPDSFAVYQKLQKFARSQGFRIAARPLPTGMPIAGSPNGSRSAAQ